MFTHLSNWELALSCNGKILAIGNAAAKISVWDLEVSKEIYTFWKDLKPITALAVNAYTNILAAGSDDNTVSVWNINTGHLIYNFGDSEYGASYLTISPNGQFLIVAHKTTPAIVKIWDLRFGHNIDTLYPNNGKINFLTVSSDGKVLVICGSKIIIYNLQTRQLLATLLQSSADSVTISSDGQTVASYKYKEVKVWQVR